MFLGIPHRTTKIWKGLSQGWTILDINECPTATKGQQQAVILSEELPAVLKAANRPHWTKHLLAYQRQQLRKGYKKKDRPKVMMKVIRQVQRHPQIGNKLKKSEETARQSRHIDMQTYHCRQTILQALLPQPFDATLGFLNIPNSPVLLHQCMNALTSPTPTKHKRGKVKTSPPNHIPKRPRSSFLPLSIPGTPDAPAQANPPQTTSSFSSTRCTEYTPNDGDTDDDLTYLDLYYQVFNKHRPEPDESNAEAAA